MPIRIKIKNWKLALLAFVFFCLFCSLGTWQLSRANQKKILLKSFHERTLHAPFLAAHLNTAQDLRFYRTQLTGSFDNAHSILLDNKIFHGKVGYEVFTPFKADGIATPILIDRGFVPMGTNRKTLPPLTRIHGHVTLTGLINQPPAYVALGSMMESTTPVWPLRIEYINMDTLSTLLNQPLFPYIVTLAPTDAAAYAIEWQIVTMGPEKHQGYAVQWFALALTLLILFVALNRDRGQT
ncbi:SURF1 family protein [Aquicella lusitana]|uniref:SURF1-like protein n=1 Tax=Aquicella lusitana TaxID=254246 RepID=A0A370GFF3_9COXI|nr:SURF1 family protein [Aquicella lusitana]RDI42417.1 surfeit locus 1 family protein [Aquicella lusitana]VVC74121.1 hypothetical protein AQULUS_18860 [Aquicella lusitana]